MTPKITISDDEDMGRKPLRTTLCSSAMRRWITRPSKLPQAFNIHYAHDANFIIVRGGKDTNFFTLFAVAKSPRGKRAEIVINGVSDWDSMIQAIQNIVPTLLIGKIPCSDCKKPMQWKDMAGQHFSGYHCHICWEIYKEQYNRCCGLCGNPEYDCSC